MTPRARRRAAVDRRRGHGRAAARDAGRARRAARPSPRCPGSRRSSARCRRSPRSIELPFAHGRLDWAARRRVAATLRGRFDVAYVLPNSIKSALLPWLARHPAARRLRRRRPLRAAQPAPAPIRPAGRRWSRSTARWPARRSTARAAAPASSTPRRSTRRGAARPRSAALLGLRARRRVRPGQALAGGALRGARALAARRRRHAGRAARLARRSRALRRDRRARRRRPAASSPAARRCSTRWR